jgi:antitoxin component of MazEF toxin-antitoxin module
MGYPTKVQLIQRQDSQQWYINFPASLAQAMEFEKGEVIEWVIQDKHTLVLQRAEKRRAEAAGGQAKKKR